MGEILRCFGKSTRQEISAIRRFVTIAESADLRGEEPVRHHTSMKNLRNVDKELKVAIGDFCLRCLVVFFGFQIWKLEDLLLKNPTNTGLGKSIGPT